MRGACKYSGHSIYEYADPHEEYELILSLLDLVLGRYSKFQTSSCIDREMKIGIVFVGYSIGS